jgi:hypothetical protein
MTSPFIEKLARAAYENMIEGYTVQTAPYDALDENSRAYYRSVVRAVLTAAMEPSEEMLNQKFGWDCVEQGHVYDEYDSDPAKLSDDAPLTIWQAMIDAALKE